LAAAAAAAAVVVVAADGERRRIHETLVGRAVSNVTGAHVFDEWVCL